MTINEWIKEITLNKREWMDISSEECKTYNKFIINLWLSMNPKLIEIIEEVQRYQVSDRDLYNFLKKILPKKSIYLNWIKPKSKKYNKDVINRLAELYNEGTSQINDSIDCFEKQDIIHILENMGLSNKEIEKLLK
jgi:hypothetical protein